MKIGKYFSYEELVKLKQHADNKPGDSELVKLVHLCVYGLDAIRDVFGPVIVTSGYRNPLYNESIGGAKKSQHLNGEAADFVVRGQRLIDVFNWIRRKHVYDQVIHEHKKDKEWIHYSYKLGDNRMVAMVADYNGSKMVYRKI
jgi:hypothetical protein